MNTDIEFLRVLETDLVDAAARVKAGEVGRSDAPHGAHRILGGAWIKATAAVIAFLVVAGGIGFFAQGGVKRSASTAGQATNPASANQDSKDQAIFGPLVPAAVPPGAGSAGSGGSRGTVGGTPQYSVGSTASQGTIGMDLSKIVRGGAISLQIPDKSFASAQAAVTKVASDAGGFVLSSSTQSERSGTFTLRVPARNFDAAMAALRNLGTVESSDSTGKDVTSQYVDLSARLRILSGRRAVILRLMDRATTISDTLTLQNQFDNVQLQIEQIQGNLNVIRNQVAESTITVDLREKDTPKSAAATVSTPSLGKSMRLAWQGFLRVIGAVVVGLGYLVPIAVLGLAIWFITRVSKRRRVVGTPV